MSKGRILYVRSGPYELNFDNYNLQEVGLGKAFCSAGYDFDIVYYSKKKNETQVVETERNTLRIFWRKGIKLLRTGIYPQVLSRKFLSQYDAVIVSEYSQIMSVMIAGRHSNTFVYNGPYYNLFKMPFMEPIYDGLCSRFLNGHAKKVFCKTRMSKDYISRKGINNSVVVGVGLDTDKFIAEKTVEDETESLLQKMEGKRNFLYVGQIIPRKNVELLVRAFVSSDKLSHDCQLVLVGSGDEQYKKKCQAAVPKEFEDKIIWRSFIKNAQLKYIYKQAEVFLLPSAQEIFGMVLLESMYFGLPVISSHSAGADTLIRNEMDGIILENFEVSAWSKKMSELMNDESKRKRMGNEAADRIKNNFTWSVIARKMISEIEK